MPGPPDRVPGPGAPPSAFQREVALLVTLGVANNLSPLAISIISPSMVQVREGFGVSNVTVGLTLSVFSIGLVCAQFLYGPLADRWPPRTIFVGALTLYLASSLAASAAPGFGLFLVARAFQALGAAAPQVVGPAVIGAVVHPSRRGRAVGTWQSITYLGFVLGPLLGSLIATNVGWRSVFVFVAAMAGVALVGTPLLPATRPRFDALSAKVLGDLVTHPTAQAAFAVGFTQVFCYHALFTFLPILFQERMNVGVWGAGAALSLIAIGLSVGGPFAGRLIDRRGPKWVLRAGLVGATASTAALASTPGLRGQEALAAVVVGTIGLGLSLALTYASPVALLLESFPTHRGSSIAAYNIARFAGGTCGPPILGLLIAPLGLAFVLAPLPVLLLGATLWATVRLEPKGRSERLRS